MSVKYKRTDDTDDGLIRWYSIDGETYGLDTEGLILDYNGVLLSCRPEALAVLREIAKFEAFK